MRTQQNKKRRGEHRQAKKIQHILHRHSDSNPSTALVNAPSLLAAWHIVDRCPSARRESRSDSNTNKERMNTSSLSMSLPVGPQFRRRSEDMVDDCLSNSTLLERARLP